MKKTKLSEILRPYENMWIALSKDNNKVIEAAKTLEQLLKKLKDKDHRDFEFMKVPDFHISYAPLF
jgi:hypothetical protein